MIGRNLQITKLKECLKKCLDYHKSNQDPTAIYLYGPPGTGKTTSFSTVSKSNSQFKKGCSVHHINCGGLAISTLSVCINSLIAALDVEQEVSKAHGRLTNPVINSLGVEQIFDTIGKALHEMNDGKLPLLVLDEIDTLSKVSAKDNNRSLFYSLMSYSVSENPQFLLVGIGNSFDLLTALPPLTQKCVTDIAFPLYTVDELLQIVSAVFKKGKENIPEGIRSLGVRKIWATYGGDCRMALDVISKMENGTDINECLGIVAECTKSAKAKMHPLLMTLPAHQQVMVVATCQMGGEGVGSGDIYNRYKAICGSLHLNPCCTPSFVRHISLLEGAGVFKVSSKVIAGGGPKNMNKARTQKKSRTKKCLGSVAAKSSACHTSNVVDLLMSNEELQDIAKNGAGMLARLMG